MRGVLAALALLGVSACATEVGLPSKTWVWERTIYNDDTVHTPNEAEAFTLTFTEDGQVQVTTDCNNMRGGYTVTDNRIEFSQMAATRMYCEGSQEQLFAGMLENVSSYFIDDDGRLILELKYDSGSMIFL
jgi:heat shock protein HslJ